MNELSFKIESIDDFPTLLKILVIGESGAGKTSLAKTWTEPKRVLLCDIENGTLSVKGSGVNVVKFDHKTVKDSEGKDVKVPLTCEEKKQRFEDVIKYARNNLGADDLLFIDSLTVLGDIVLEVLRIKYTDNKDNMKLWGDFLTTMVKCISFIKDLPTNVVVTSLRATEMDANNVKIEKVMLSGQAGVRIPPLFDEVYMARVVKKDDGTHTHYLVTGTEEGTPCKSRGGVLNKYEKLDLAAIRSKITQAKKGETKNV